MGIMTTAQIQTAIAEGRTALGIELGSTRIKAVLIGPDHAPLASGGHFWENRLEDGVWTYHMDDVWNGLRDCYRALSADVREKYGATLTTVGAMGISAMMHGYLAFDRDGGQLVPFRTWRNTMTEQAAQELTAVFGFNIPQRWSVAHVYQAILNGEPHVREIAFLTTLAGYVHWKLTGEKVLGAGEASGMFPIDGGGYNGSMAARFDGMTAARGIGWTLNGILPKVLTAGDAAGVLTAGGARLLDPSGALRPGIPLCPPEGDAGTGMAATNSVAERTGNVSAGTSIFAMVVLEKPLGGVYAEIDMVTTPTGKPVAMVHCNNCTSDIDAWVRLFGETLRRAGLDMEKSALYDLLYNAALDADPTGGGLLSYNYFSGEPITALDEGRPVFARRPDAELTLANFMRVHLYSALATLKLGMDILFERERVALDRLLGHGGFFKTKGVGQRMMAAAAGVPVAVMETAGEGGAWGIALLAAYMVGRMPDETLEAYLGKRVFAGSAGERVDPCPADREGFAVFMERYRRGLAIERAAVSALEK